MKHSLEQHDFEPGKYTSQVSYCFCTLAFGDPYRRAAKKLASQIQQYGIKLVVATDRPKDFVDLDNVIPVKFNRTSIMYPYNDKRFALSAALERYECAILTDADISIDAELPQAINIAPGMYADTTYRSLNDDLLKFHKKNFNAFTKLATKLGVDLKQAQWVCENLIIIRRDKGREQVFLNTWAFADRWLGIRRKFQGDHGYIGLAAAVAGWKVSKNGEFEFLRKIIEHHGHKSIGVTGKTWTNKSFITRRALFYYRWLMAFLYSLKRPGKYWF